MTNLFKPVYPPVPPQEPPLPAPALKLEVRASQPVLKCLVYTNTLTAPVPVAPGYNGPRIS